MNNSSLEILEYAALKALVGRYVSTSLGQAELAKVAPSTDRELLERVLAETAEAMQYNEGAVPSSNVGRGSARLVFQDLPDAAQALARISIEGASLEAREILEADDQGPADRANGSFGRKPKPEGADGGCFAQRLPSRNSRGCP